MEASEDAGPTPMRRGGDRRRIPRVQTRWAGKALALALACSLSVGCVADPSAMDDGDRDAVCALTAATFQVLAAALSLGAAGALAGPFAGGVCALYIDELLSDPGKAPGYDLVVDGTELPGVTGDDLTGSASEAPTCEDWRIDEARFLCLQGDLEPPPRLQG